MVREFGFSERGRESEGPGGGMPGPSFLQRVRRGTVGEGRRTRGTLAVALLAGGVGAGGGDVREVAVKDLKQVAVVSRDGKGPVIYYSPELCVEVGPSACAYERVHAQMLATRGDVPRQKPGDPYDTAWITPREILQADCRAANELRGQGGAAAPAPGG